jgi:hypothetical protein
MEMRDPANDLLCVEIDNTYAPFTKLSHEETPASEINIHVVDATGNIAQRNLGFELQQVRDGRRSGRTKKHFG